LQADQVDVEAAQTLDDHGQPLVEVLAVTAKTEAAVEDVEADDAERPWRVYGRYRPGEGEQEAATSENPSALHRPAFLGSVPERRGTLEHAPTDTRPRSPGSFVRDRLSSIGMVGDRPIVMLALLGALTIQGCPPHEARGGSGVVRAGPVHASGAVGGLATRQQRETIEGPYGLTGVRVARSVAAEVCFTQRFIGRGPGTRRRHVGHRGPRGSHPGARGRRGDQAPEAPLLALPGSQAL